MTTTNWKATLTKLASVAKEKGWRYTDKRIKEAAQLYIVTDCHREATEDELNEAVRIYRDVRKA